ncbi:hypothetical protein [Nonomuraea typhae]|uniref:hypothetical protein n=1 Tax=Nonomuraea typhae TaxID=2603600 RepID=UPI0012FC9628|nr:hypothetical protein [Nonomuraea typhae]
MRSPTRRTLLTAAAALPAVALAPGVSDAEVVSAWKPITLTGAANAFADAPPQARVVRVAGTDFLQLRGGAHVSYTADSPLGTLPSGLRVPKLTRGLCPRNNHNGLSVCRVEADVRGVLIVLGGTTASKITWVRLDGFSSVLS